MDPCTRGCGRAGLVVCGGCGFAGLWRFPEEEAALGNHSPQSPASVWVANSGYPMGHYKARGSLCTVHQVCWNLYWGLLEGWAGGLWGLRFCRFMEISRGSGSSTRQPQRTEPCQCVGGQPWACHRPLKGQIHLLQCSAGVVEPALGAAAGLGRLFAGVAVLPSLLSV